MPFVIAFMDPLPLAARTHSITWTTVESFYAFSRSRALDYSLHLYRISHRPHKVTHKKSLGSRGRWNWRTNVCHARTHYYHCRASNERLLFYSFNAQPELKRFRTKRNKKKIILWLLLFCRKNPTHRHTHRDAEVGKARGRKPANPHKSSKIDGYSMVASPICVRMRQRNRNHASDRNNRVATSLKTNTIYFTKWLALTGSTIPCLMAHKPIHPL